VTNIRRYETSGRTVFITAVCSHRLPHLEMDWQKDLLLSVMREVKSASGFVMRAYAILDDHFHWMITPGNSEFSSIMQSIKLRYVHRYKKKAGIMERETLWQRRFWDHIIRNDEDLHRHMDYIHYNPVRHGYVEIPMEYQWSSLKTHIQMGNYDSQWGISVVPKTIDSMDLE
jgi:putative transposase